MRGGEAAVFSHVKNKKKQHFLPLSARGWRGKKRCLKLDVNQKELAKIIGVTDRRVRQLQNEYGLFEKGRTEGKKTKNYCLEKCVPEYINYRLEAEAKQGTTIIKEKEQAEHEQIKKKISILKLRKLKKELHEASDVEEFLTNMLINFKNHILAVPQKIAPIVISENDINKIIDIIEKEMFAALDELAEYDPMQIDKEKDVSFFEDEEE